MDMGRPLRALALGMALHAAFSPAAQSAPRTPDAQALMDWAERSYAQFFPAPRPATLSQPPYVYRHYPATQNYLGVAGQDVYVFGPVSQSQLLKVGTLSDFACLVYPTDCVSGVAEYGAFQLLGFAASTSASGAATLVAFDPAQPAAAPTPLAASPTGDDLNRVSTSPPAHDDRIASPAYARDSATGLQRYLGAAMRFYASNGQLYQVDLRRGQAARAVPVSSTRVSWVEAVIPMDDSGLDAWVVAVQNPAPGSDQGAQRVLVRSSTPADQPAALLTPLSMGLDGHYPFLGGYADPVLRDDQGRARWLAGMERRGRQVTMRLYGAADLSPGPATDFASPRGWHPAKPRQAYAAAAGALSRVRWEDDGSSVVLPPHYVRQSNTTPLVLATADAGYHADGAAIVRLPDDGSAATVVATVPYDRKAADPAVRLNYIALAQTPTQVIYAVRNGYLQTMEIGAVPKAGGAARILATVASEGAHLTFLGTHGEQVLYGVDVREPDSVPLPHLKHDRLMRIRSDGSAKTVVEPKVYLAGVVADPMPATRGYGSNLLPELAGVVACRSAAPTPSCTAAELLEYRPAADTLLRLGKLPILAGGDLLQLNAVDGLPARIGFNAWVAGSPSTQLGMFRPGVANSLVVLAPLP